MHIRCSRIGAVLACPESCILVSGGGRAHSFLHRTASHLAHDHLDGARSAASIGQVGHHEEHIGRAPNRPLLNRHGLRVNEHTRCTTRMLSTPKCLGRTKSPRSGAQAHARLSGHSSLSPSLRFFSPRQSYVKFLSSLRTILLLCLRSRWQRRIQWCVRCRMMFHRL
jgi:hypothetical protein